MIEVLSLEDLLNQNLTRGYFGKLPAFSDFVKFNAGNNEVLVLDKWLQEGIILSNRKLKNDWKSVYKKSRPIKFFYPFTGTDKIILGIIFPSNDKNGREFPFLMFININENIFNRTPFYLVPLIFQNEFSEYKSIFSKINGNTTRAELNELTNRISFLISKERANEKYQDFISNSLQGNYWRRILGADENNKYNIVNNIFNPKVKNSSLALEFKIILNEESSYLDLCFLLNLAAHSKNNLLLPAIFWTENIDYEIRLFLFPKRPVPINYLNIIHSSEKNDSILLADKREETIPVSDEIKNLLDREEMSLIELFHAINP